MKQTDEANLNQDEKHLNQSLIQINGPWPTKWAPVMKWIRIKRFYESSYDFVPILAMVPHEALLNSSL